MSAAPTYAQAVPWTGKVERTDGECVVRYKFWEDGSILRLHTVTYSEGDRLWWACWEGESWDALDGDLAHFGLARDTPPPVPQDVLDEAWDRHVRSGYVRVPWLPPSDD